MYILAFENNERAGLRIPAKPVHDTGVMPV
jgi:hypothetical protein